MSNELSQQYKQALELHNKILVSAQLAQNSLWDMCTALKEMRDGNPFRREIINSRYQKSNARAHRARASFRPATWQR